ncbi:hypothetical protein DFR69_104262 [Nocardia neocaledoniensis]|uniref:Uncharacterized protein n=1 Tax=Nocardia neocaledoniensis TaxID=236511 RepID=A0A317NLI6_9NOCA|nr:hypothetical protein DFR69_104262 [Nocardia neocaledoniensis]
MIEPWTRADRADVCALLDAALADGQLTERALWTHIVRGAIACLSPPEEVYSPKGSPSSPGGYSLSMSRSNFINSSPLPSFIGPWAYCRTNRRVRH